jgi:hypothetical protein
MITKARTAFFVGIPSEQEQVLLMVLSERYHVYMLDHASGAYQQMVHRIPDVVIFASNQSNTTALKLFRQLRRLERVGVIVSGTQKIQGFAGRRYQRRRDALNNQASFRALLDWLDRLCSIAEADHYQRVWLHPVSPATAEKV